MILLVLAFPVRGDMLDSKSGKAFGRIARMDKDGITINQLCDSRFPKTVSWENLRYIDFNNDSNDCKEPHSVFDPGHGPAYLTCENEQVYVLSYAERNQLYVKELYLDDKTFRILLVNHKWLSGPAESLRQVKTLSKSKICKKDFQKAFTIPASMKEE
jgi:hypothetical protein